MCVGFRHAFRLLCCLLLHNFNPVSGGTCWSAMVRDGKCTELISESSTREDCCNRFGVATAWSGEDHDPGALFFWRVLGGGVSCTACKESCVDVDCGKDHTCVMRNNKPKCICAPKCNREAAKRRPKGAVCGSDGRSYRNICRLKKRACRRHNNNLHMAYYGICQNSCDRINCPSGKRCILDQNRNTHCVKCIRKCPGANPKRRRVCGIDGVTYPSACHLREVACERGAAIPIAYKGTCNAQATCSQIHCQNGQTCLQNSKGFPQCVSCLHRCKRKHLLGPLCGSNNNTYSSWCSMMKDSCAKRFVIETKYSGKCNLNEETIIN